MNRIIKIGWLMGGVLIFLLSYFSFQHNDENSHTEFLDLDPFAKEIATEAEDLFEQIMTDKSMVYSDSLGQIIRSEKWYFLSFQKS